MSEQVLVAALRVAGRHGVTAGERAQEQPFEIDIEIDADIGRSCTSDDLADTVDYAEVVQRARAIVETMSFALLERLSDEIARAVISLDEKVSRVRVTVRKMKPPLDTPMGFTAVRVERVRGR